MEKDIESVKRDQFQRASPRGQAEPPRPSINMGLDNSGFQTAGRGFPGGGEVTVIKASPARGGGWIFRRTEKVGRGLIA